MPPRPSIESWRLPGKASTRRRTGPHAPSGERSECLTQLGEPREDLVSSPEELLGFAGRIGEGALPRLHAQLSPLGPLASAVPMGGCALPGLPAELSAPAPLDQGPGRGEALAVGGLERAQDSR